MDAVELVFLNNYQASIKKQEKHTKRQLTSIEDIYTKIKSSNQADIVSPNWTLPLSEQEIYIPACQGMLNGLPVYTQRLSVSELIVSNGLNSVNLCTELGTNHLMYSTSRMVAHSGYGHTFPHPTGVVVRLQMRTYAPNATKGILVLLDDSLAVDSVIELGQSDISTYFTDNFAQTIAVMSTEGTIQAICYDTKKLKYYSMSFDGTGYKYTDGINWTYDAKNYSLRNGILYQDNTAIYTGIDTNQHIYPLGKRMSMDNVYDPYGTYRPIYNKLPFCLGFDGDNLFWNNSVLGTTISGGVPIPSVPAYQHVKMIEVN
jgi:hypothetical protein